MIINKLRIISESELNNKAPQINVRLCNFTNLIYGVSGSTIGGSSSVQKLVISFPIQPSTGEANAKNIAKDLFSGFSDR